QQSNFLRLYLVASGQFLADTSVTWMPQRKVLVATSILLFDFELFMGERCRLFADRGHLMANHEDPCYNDRWSAPIRMLLTG
ncbi:MAG: hypothetical protein ACYS19_15185, partial [Planctomycetota bacterium]